MYACGAKVTFIEVQNNNTAELAMKYQEVAFTSPDYFGIDNNTAIQDYINRVKKYEINFESLGKNMDERKAVVEERAFSYLVCDHSREHFVSHNIKGYLPQKVVHFIEIMRTTTHSFYLSRYIYILNID